MSEFSGCSYFFLSFLIWSVLLTRVQLLFHVFRFFFYLVYPFVPPEFLILEEPLPNVLGEALVPRFIIAVYYQALLPRPFASLGM